MEKNEKYIEDRKKYAENLICSLKRNKENINLIKYDDHVKIVEALEEVTKYYRDLCKTFEIKLNNAEYKLISDYDKGFEDGKQIIIDDYNL